MTNTIELFQKMDNKWVELSLKSFTGKAIRKEVWERLDGKDIVGKLTRGGKLIGYVAGTPELRQHYRGKEARVWSWTEAAGMMEEKGSALLDDDGGILGEVLKVFGEGCKVEKVDYKFSA